MRAPRNRLVTAATAYRSLLAAAEEAPPGEDENEPSTGAIIALLPAADDPIVAASSQLAHVTMVYLGDAADLEDGYADVVRDYVADLARAGAPMTAVPESRGELGDESADVVFVRGDGLTELHDLLVSENGPVIDASTFEFNPHVTLGYPAEPAEADYDPDANDEVRFDRLAVWIGEDRQEYALGGDAPGDDTADVSPGETNAATGMRWAGPITLEGEITGDGRMLARDSLYWPDDLSEQNPLPFRTVREDIGAHDNAVTSGHIFTIERLTVEQANERLVELGRPALDAPAGVRVIWGVGDFDAGSDYGVEGARLVRERLQTGVSVDLDDVAFEVRVASELLEGEDEEGGLLIASAGDDPDDNGRDYEVVFEMAPDDEIMVTTSARIRSATQVAIPAFAYALIGMLDDEADTPALIVEDVHADPEANEAAAREAEEFLGLPEGALLSADAIIAAAAPVEPPRAWFADPSLRQPTPITITDDGRVFGHLATWDVCHIASPAGEGVCVVAPHSAMGYGRFHTGSLRTAEGATIGVGRITMGTGHAGPRATAASAAAHYDNTGTAVADVRAGEDAYGIWVAGALRPEVTAEQVRALRSSPLSGDWRRVDGNLELHAALAVNVPGFPIPRPAGLVASGELQALVASGVVVGESTVDAATTPGVVFSASDLAYLERAIEREKMADRRALAERVAASKAAIARRKVAAFAARR